MATGSPCGACKFLRRKCTSDCIFAPYFSSDQSSAQFAAIHKVFGASNVSKLLSQLPANDRYEAVITVAYEAQARIRDPVYGCVGHIFALQQQVAILQAQLMQVRAQLAYKAAHLPQVQDQNHHCAHENPSSSALLQSMYTKKSLDHCMDYDGLMLLQQLSCKEESVSTQLEFSKKRAAHHEFGELQAMAQRMMRS
ncbi:LOB domain-containing protein 29-like isoform X2 [Canna indica]|uniref:LOB domain-containing protein 29-like isoform X2 n=1 Tax=Canna indica TaxID=4628 RepID=A0AAQ3JN79_9LILI|nr:LOB domain-containing protein 29-like isoform X2 [Canna indica]